MYWFYRNKPFRIGLCSKLLFSLKDMNLEDSRPFSHTFLTPIISEIMLASSIHSSIKMNACMFCLAHFSLASCFFYNILLPLQICDPLLFVFPSISPHHSFSLPIVDCLDPTQFSVLCLVSCCLKKKKKNLLSSHLKIFYLLPTSVIFI